MARHVWKSNGDHEVPGVGVSYTFLRWAAAIGTIFTIVWTLLLFVRGLELASIQREISVCQDAVAREECDRKEADREAEQRQQQGLGDIKKEIQATRQSIDDLRNLMLAKSRP